MRRPSSDPLPSRLVAAGAGVRTSGGTVRSSIADTTYSGSQIVNCAPLSRPSEWTSMRPPCRSTSCCTSASPMPMPPWWRVRFVCCWPNSWKMCGSAPASMPCPLSLTSSRASLPSRTSDTVTRPPDGVNLIALLSRFQAIWRRRTGSACTISGSAVRFTSSAMPFCSASRATAPIESPTMNGSGTRCCCIASLPVITRDTSSRSSTRRACVAAVW